MSDEKTTETIELQTPEPIEAKAPVVPTRSELKEKGWSANELDAAEKHGMISKPEEKKVEEKPKLEVLKPEETKQEGKIDEAKAIQKRLNGSLPDFQLTPEQEKVFLETFGAGTQPRAMYFGMKHERQKRQAAEAEREKISARTKQLEDEVAVLKSGRVPKPETDEDGNIIDPEDKPFTMKQWKEMQRKEQEDRQREEDEIRTKGGAVAEALKTQEEYAKSIYPDFDRVVKLATDLIKNMDELIPNKWERDRAVELVKNLNVRAVNAPEYGADDYNAAMISYELGKLHPDYLTPTDGEEKAETNDGKQKDPSKANGSLTPEQMKRIEQNTQRRTSSASIPGGTGRRVVSADEISLKDLNGMSDSQRLKFKKDHPARYDKLLRG